MHASKRTKLSEQSMGQTISNSFVWTRGGDDGDGGDGENPEETALEPLGPAMPVPVELGETATMPKRATSGSAGFDLCASEDVVLPANGVYTKVKTGVKMAIGTPQSALRFGEGVVVFGAVRGRSGLTSKGIDVFHGTVDADYRGELVVLMRNTTNADFQIKPGDRIAQMVFSVALIPALVEYDDVAKEFDTERGAGGFGSTGVAAVAAVAAVEAVGESVAASETEEAAGERV